LGFSRTSQKTLFVTGGAISSPQIIRRVAAIWNRPVIVTDKGGAALGAAVAGVSAFQKSKNEPFDVEDFNSAVLSRAAAIYPRPEDVAAFHNPGGYLDRFAAAESTLLKKHHVK
jgi:xylulokinase